MNPKGQRWWNFDRISIETRLEFDRNRIGLTIRPDHNWIPTAPLAATNCEDSDYATSVCESWGFWPRHWRPWIARISTAIQSEFDHSSPGPQSGSDRIMAGIRLSINDVAGRAKLGSVMHGCPFHVAQCNNTVYINSFEWYSKITKVFA